LLIGVFTIVGRVRSKPTLRASRAWRRTRKTKTKLTCQCAGAAFGLCATAGLRARPPPRHRPFAPSL